MRVCPPVLCAVIVAGIPHSRAEAASDLPAAHAIELSLTNPRAASSRRTRARTAAGATESFVFRLVVREAGGHAAEPENATIELRSGARTVKTIR